MIEVKNLLKTLLMKKVAKEEMLGCFTNHERGDFPGDGKRL